MEASSQPGSPTRLALVEFQALLSKGFQTITENYIRICFDAVAGEDGKASVDDFVDFVFAGDAGDSLRAILKANLDLRKEVDLRYDTEGFHHWADQQTGGRYGVAWLKVGFVKYQARLPIEQRRLPRRQQLERIPGACHVGAPPASAQLYYTSFAWQDFAGKEADPEGHVLQDLASVLDQEGAMDSDLVFFMGSSMFIYADDGRFIHDVPIDSCPERKLFDAVNRSFAPMLCYWKVITILLPRVYMHKRLTKTVAPSTPFLHRVWAMLDIVLSAYCQRVVSLREDAEAQQLIRDGMDPSRFEDLEALFMHELYVRKTEDREVAWNMLSSTLKRLTPIRHDTVGFENFCNESGIAWLRVAYVRDLAAKGGPFPRRQELPQSGYLVGAPPRGIRKFVVSHGWETEVHPNPSGSRMRRLGESLSVMRAKDQDVVFFDFCSLSQENKMGRSYEQDQPWKGMPARSAYAEPYFRENNISYYPPRSPLETKNFKFSMWEMGRLYSFCECEVIVLPGLDGPGKAARDRFPGGDVWGQVNDAPYRNRGWCCAEFSIAHYCGIIKNLNDVDVQQVLSSRRWPRDNRSYADMMRRTTRKEVSGADLTHDAELGVDFTNSGDRAVVTYNFFKMALSLK